MYARSTVHSASSIRNRSVKTLVAPFLGLTGITDISFIYADGLASGEAEREKSIAEARSAIQNAIGSW